MNRKSGTSLDRHIGTRLIRACPIADLLRMKAIWESEDEQALLVRSSSILSGSFLAAQGRPSPAAPVAAIAPVEGPTTDEVMEFSDSEEKLGTLRGSIARVGFAGSQRPDTAESPVRGPWEENGKACDGVLRKID